MKVFVLAFVAVLACAAAFDVNHLTKRNGDEIMEPEQFGWILNSQGKKAVKELMQQLPCGWPEYGIPPLAPYTNPDITVHVARSVIDSFVQMLRFRFDGLNEMEVINLKISYTFSQRVKYHFNFRRLTASAQTFNTNTFIDFMKELGFDIRYEGTGQMEFELENLSFQGSFKYKMPFLWGSIKIYKFECVVALGGVRSNIGGVLGNGRLNRLINDEIEYQIPAYVNGNQKMISQRIEEFIVPTVNESLKGMKVWDLIFSGGSGSGEVCNPAPAPWSYVE